MLSAENPDPDRKAQVGRPSAVAELDHMIAGGLDEWLAVGRLEGLSYETMARRLSIDYGVDVSRESIRRWVAARA